MKELLLGAAFAKRVQGASSDGQAEGGLPRDALGADRVRLPAQEAARRQRPVRSSHRRRRATAARAEHAPRISRPHLRHRHREELHSSHRASKLIYSYRIAIIYLKNSF